MPRFALYSHHFDSLYVVAETKKAAVPLLKVKWDKAVKQHGYDDEKAVAAEIKFEAKKVRQVGERKLRFAPRPTCCKKARLKKDSIHRHAIIQLDVDYFHEDEKRPEKPPHWAFLGHKIKYCPWCRKRLPKVERNPSPPKPTFHTSDGNYCDTCGERNSSCECNPPGNNYRIVESAPKGASVCPSCKDLAPNGCNYCNSGGLG